MQDPTSKPFWILWAVAFVGFPAAGVAARLVGAVTTPTRALLAGAISGATLGLVLPTRSRVCSPSRVEAFCLLKAMFGMPQY